MNNLRSEQINKPSLKPEASSSPNFSAYDFEGMAEEIKAIEADLGEDFRKHVGSMVRVARAYRSTIQVPDNIISDIIFHLEKWAERYDNGPEQYAAGISAE